MVLLFFSGRLSSLSYVVEVLKSSDADDRFYLSLNILYISKLWQTWRMYQFRRNVRKRTFRRASSEDWNQPTHPYSLIRDFVVLMKELCISV